MNVLTASSIANTTHQRNRQWGIFGIWTPSTRDQGIDEIPCQNLSLEGRPFAFRLPRKHIAPRNLWTQPELDIDLLNKKKQANNHQP